MNADHDIESALRDDLTRIGGAVRPAHGLADRLIANASSGTRTVVPLRRSRRFVAPLLAAAVCVVLVGGIVVVNRFNADRQGPAVAPTITTDRTTAALTTTAVTTETPTTAAPSSSLPPGVSMSLGGPLPSPVKFDWWRVLPAATGAPKGFTGSYNRFLNADTGFVLGEAPCPQNVNNCLKLIRTDGGGATWMPLAVPQKLKYLSILDGCDMPAVQSESGCIDKVIFDDSDHGYLYGDNHAYATSDGGRSWKLVPSPRPNRDYTFVGDRVLRVVAHSSENFYPYGVQSAPAGSTDFRPLTDDQFSDSDTFRIYQSGPVTYLKTGSSLENVTKGLFRTRDARVWERVTLPCGKRDFVPLYPAQDGSMFTDCSDVTSEMYVLTAAGTAWTRIPSPRLDGSRGGSLVSVTSAERFALLVRIEGQGDLQSWVATDDGGKTWNEPRELQAAFPTDDLGSRLTTAAGVVLILRFQDPNLTASFDDGETWQQRAFG